MGKRRVNRTAGAIAGAIWAWMAVGFPSAALAATETVVEPEALSAPWYPGVDPVPVLNIGGFSTCMASAAEEPGLSLPEIAQVHGLGISDGLLPYLAVYPGVRPSQSAGWLQDWAHGKWQVRFEEPEALLAEFLDQGRGTLAPSAFFARALELCSEWEGSDRPDLLCAAMLGHNLMRTLGRFDRAVYFDRRFNRWVDLNPGWFRANRDHWIEARERIRERLIPLRREGAEKFGEWYHFFGILAFSVRELAVNGNLKAVESAMRWNRRLNPILAGDFEEPEKARLDEDSIRVSELLTYLMVNGGVPAPLRTPEGRAWCASPEAYRLGH